MASDGFVFGGGLWPIGWSVGYIERSLAEVAEAVEAWRHGAAARRYPSDDLAHLLERLPPLEFLRTGGGCSSGRGQVGRVLRQRAAGRRPVPWTSHLSDVLSCRGVTATHIPAGQYPYPATSFEIFSPDGEPPLMSLRTVHAGIYDEGRWSFEAHGAVQP